MLTETARFAAALGALYPSILYMEHVRARMAAVAQGVDCHDFIDAKLLLDPTSLAKYLTCLGDDGRKAHRELYALDWVVFPMIYSIVIAGLIKRVSGTATYARTSMAVPYIGAMFDVLENSAVICILNNYPNYSERLAGVLSTLTTLKFAFLTTGLLLLLVLGIGRCLQRAHYKAD